MKKLLMSTVFLFVLGCAMNINAVWNPLSQSPKNESESSSFVDSSGCQRKMPTFQAKLLQGVSYLKLLFRMQTTSLDSFQGLMNLAVTEINPKIKDYSAKDVKNNSKDILAALKKYINDPASNKELPSGFTKDTLKADLFLSFVNGMEAINYSKIYKNLCVVKSISGSGKNAKITNAAPQSILQAAADGK